MNSSKLKKRLNVKSPQVHQRLAKRLNRLCKFLDLEYDINAGGCCFVTYNIAKLLKSSGFKFKVVIYDDYKIEERDFYHLVETHYHYGILLGKYPINDDNCWKDRDFKKTLFSKVVPEDILEHYNEGLDWNSMYSKDKNEFIAKTIKVFYNDFIKDLQKEGY